MIRYKNNIKDADYFSIKLHKVVKKVRLEDLSCVVKKLNLNLNNMPIRENKKSNIITDIDNIDSKVIQVNMNLDNILKMEQSTMFMQSQLDKMRGIQNIDMQERSRPEVSVSINNKIENLAFEISDIKKYIMSKANEKSNDLKVND